MAIDLQSPTAGADPANPQGSNPEPQTVKEIQMPQASDPGKAPGADGGEPGKGNQDGEPKFTTEELQRLGIKHSDGKFTYKPEGSTSIYEAATIDELLGKVFSGVAEKDQAIERLKTKPVLNRPSMQSRKEEEQAPPATQAVDPNQIRREIFDRLLKDNQLDPKYFNYTALQWKEAEEELGAVQASDLFQTVKNVRQSLHKQTQEAVETRNLEIANERLGSDAIDAVMDFLEDEKMDITQDVFDSLFNKSLADERSWNDGKRLRPEQVLKTFQRLAREHGKKPAAATTVAPNLQKPPLPPGVITERGTGGPSPAPPNKPEIKNLNDAAKLIEEQIRAGKANTKH